MKKWYKRILDPQVLAAVVAALAAIIVALSLDELD